MLIIYSDPHLGLLRSSNTTPASKKALQEDLFNAVERIHETYKGATKLCAGDFFDTYSNEESVITRAAPLFYDLDSCLSGNHDVVNREGKLGSLGLLAALHGVHSYEGHICTQAEYGKASFSQARYADAEVFSVPHVANAELFEQSLRMAEAALASATHAQSVPTVLMLHCNYDNSLAAEKEATLNLTRERAGKLLETFNYIVMGHVHQPMADFDGRLQVIGNTHPTGFGDLGDKRILKLDNGLFESVPIYLAADHEAVVDVDVLLEGQLFLPTETRFLQITGNLPVERAAELAKAISRLWKTVDGLRCLRSKVDFVKPDQVAEVNNSEGFLSLPEIIDQELQSRPDQLAIWKEVTENA